jgi:hypothetical protein
MLKVEEFVSVLKKGTSFGKAKAGIYITVF